MGQFFADSLGLELLVNTDDVSAVTDGTMNIILVRGELFSPEAVKAPGYVGVHHIGFQVDSRPEWEERVAAHGGTKIEGQEEEMTADQAAAAGFEVKWRTPEGIVFDLSEDGWPTGDAET
jgi:methylmalonyl-CoA/ethylmalonyl-CoA epimerase